MKGLCIYLCCLFVLFSGHRVLLPVFLVIFLREPFLVLKNLFLRISSGPGRRYFLSKTVCLYSCPTPKVELDFGCFKVNRKFGAYEPGPWIGVELWSSCGCSFSGIIFLLWDSSASCLPRNLSDSHPILFSFLVHSIILVGHNLLSPSHLLRNKGRYF